MLESKGTPGICVFLMCCCIIPSRRCYPAQSFQNFELNKHIFFLYKVSRFRYFVITTQTEVMTPAGGNLPLPIGSRQVTPVI